MQNTGKEARQQVFDRQIDRLERQISGLSELDRRYFWIRLGTLLAGSLALVLALRSEQTLWVLRTLLAFSGIFTGVVFFHRRVDRSARRFKLSRSYYSAQRARSCLDWARIPPAPIVPPDRRHPFAADLNLTGERSLQQLLDTAVSQGGSQRLRQWLLQPAPAELELRDRQALVRELLPRAGFRSRLALNGALASTGEHDRWDGEALLRWLEQNQPGRPLLRNALALLAILAPANLILFVLGLFQGAPPYWIITTTLYLGGYMWFYRDLGEVFGQAQDLATTLDRFRVVFQSLETYPYQQGSGLARLCKPFIEAGERPSTYLRRVARIASAASLQNNPILSLFLNALVPWGAFFAYQLQQVKAALRARLPAWLETWYELEAANSLANFAYLNPGYIFPEVVFGPAAEEDPVFMANLLGHPLIPDEVKVHNDFTLEGLGQLALITGSNMSGKSTFLRTVGVNLCLAFAGAPVNAARLRTSAFRLFTCIEVSDSLGDGISYFYAEVRRLKAILSALKSDGPLPLFFLIDEIFRGTNNRERQIGGRAYVQALVGGHGAGLISTHDLELVTLAEQLPGVENYHFQEEVSGGRMVFDYRLRPGPSPTTNALKIMEMEGLPVPA